MPALETLAVISYKQPVTGPEIAEIRGVNTSGVLKTLLDKRLITTAGRKEVMGRPILYRTSKEFLMRFGLSDLQELPSLKEFEALAREALGSDEGMAQEETYASASPEEAAGEQAAASPEHASSEAEHAARQEHAIQAQANQGQSNREQASGATQEHGEHVERGPATVGEDLIEEEKIATSEGMPAGETDESPKAAVAGE
jgi:segregation and condensation protein B